jgi:NADH:ubiquinone oxidoreductase subunit D
MGRTRAARLRGFGNAICLPLAKSFVEAMIDAFADFVQTTIELPRGSAQTTVEQPCGEAGAQPVSSVARVRGEEDAA